MAVFTQAKAQPLTLHEFREHIYNLLDARPDLALHFALEGTNLRGGPYWGAYIRQSLEEQSKNNRIPDYLFTCAQWAKRLGVMVPLEYIWYDSESGTHMERPVLIHVRQSIIKGKRVAGILFPTLDRLTRIPSHLEEFERHCEHAGVRYFYCNMPDASGTDAMSKMMRQNYAHFAKMVVDANRTNNLGGRVGMIYKGSVPPGRPPFGYLYQAEKKEGRVISSWLELDGAYPDATPFNPLHLQSREQLASICEYGSRAYYAALIYYLCIKESLSAKSIAALFNEEGYPPPSGYKWHDAIIAGILRNSAYYGLRRFNRWERKENPEHDLSPDITAAVRKTIIREKPKEAQHTYPVPALVTEEAWLIAQQILAGYTSWRGGSAPVYPLLLRGYIYCPKCMHRMGALLKKDKRADGSYNPMHYYACRWQGCPKPPWVLMRKEKAEAMAREQLGYFLQNPKAILEEIQRQEQAEHSEGLPSAADYWQNKVAEAKQQVVKLQQGWAKGIFTDEEVEPLLKQARAKLQELSTVAERASRQQVERKKVIASLEQMAEQVAADVAFNLDNDESFRTLLKRFRVGIIPTANGESLEVVLDFHPIEGGPDDGPEGGSVPEEGNGEVVSRNDVSAIHHAYMIPLALAGLRLPKPLLKAS